MQPCTPRLRRTFRVIAVALIPALLGLVAPAATAAAGSIAWTACTSPNLAGFECGTFTVPRDYAKPSAGTFTMAAIRRANLGGPEQRIGSLVFNPGGPGMSGLDDFPLVYSMLPQVAKQRFDLVAWDPRGVGASEPKIDCTLGEMRLPLTGPVDWPKAQAQLRSSTAAANAACWKKHADVLPLVGTNNVVRDLDRLRAALGDEQLTYWGQSYGTRIGYDYALTYPSRVRAMLLDGSVNPNGTLRDFVQEYAVGADAALSLFFQMYPDARQKFTQSLERLQTTTLTLPSGLIYSRWSLLRFAEMIARGESSWPQLANHIALVHGALFTTDDRSAARLSALDDVLKVYPRTAIVDGPPTVVSAIDCVDYPDRLSAKKQDAIAKSARLKAPISGWMNGILLGVQCDGLPVKADPVPTSFPAADGSRMLLAGATKDAATAYHWTVAMARAFPGARTVTYVGGQHVTYGFVGSTCVDDVVSQFLIDGVQPPYDVACLNVGRRS